VGVTDYCDYPPEARTKEKLGLPMSPNLERLVVLRPDLVLVPFGVPQEVLDRLTELRVAYLGLNPHTLADALSWMRRIGQVAGIAVHAETVVGRLEARVAAVTEKTAGLTEKEKPTVLLVFWTDPLMSFGPDTFGDDLIRLAGGRNFTGKAAQPYPVVNWEVVVRRDPDVILLTGHTGEEQPSLEQEPGWTQLKAVRTSQVHTFSDGDLITVPGPRLVDGLEQMARWLHPELCGRKGREGEGGGMQEKVGK
jgi:iron complex transport system substrate-binding protein